MTTSRRNRFYKKVFLQENSIPTSDEWKNLKMFDSDGVTEINNKLEFPTNLTSIIIVNDDEKNIIEFSFNGQDLDGEMFSDDGAISQDCTSEGYLYLRLPADADLKVDELIQVRIWGWRGGAGR